MCAETCVKISDKSDKNEEVIAYASWVVRSDRGVVRTNRVNGRKGGVGGGVMAQCIDFFFS